MEDWRPGLGFTTGIKNGPSLGGISFYPLLHPPFYSHLGQNSNMEYNFFHLYVTIEVIEVACKTALVVYICHRTALYFSNESCTVVYCILYNMYIGRYVGLILILGLGLYPF